MTDKQLTQEQVIAFALEAGFENYESTSLSGKSQLDRTLQVGEYPVGESVFALAAISYAAGRKDENETCEALAAYILKMKQNDVNVAIRTRKRS